MNMLRGFLCVTGLLACLAVTSGQFIPRQTNSATLVARSDCVNAIEQVQNHWLQAFSVAKQGHTQLVDACLRVKLECQAPGQQRSWSWGVWLAVLAATVTTLCCYIYIRALHQQNCLQKNQLTARVRHFESQWLHAQREAFEYSQVLHAAFNEESQLYEDICGAVVQDAVKSPAKCQSTHPYKTCIDKAYTHDVRDKHHASDRDIICGVPAALGHAAFLTPATAPKDNNGSMPEALDTHMEDQMLCSGASAGEAMSHQHLPMAVSAAETNSTWLLAVEADSTTETEQRTGGKGCHLTLESLNQQLSQYNAGLASSGMPQLQLALLPWAAACQGTATPIKSPPTWMAALSAALDQSNTTNAANPMSPAPPGTHDNSSDISPLIAVSPRSAFVTHKELDLLEQVKTLRQENQQLQHHVQHQVPLLPAPDSYVNTVRGGRINRTCRDTDWGTEASGDFAADAAGTNGPNMEWSPYRLGSCMQFSKPSERQFSRSGLTSNASPQSTQPDSQGSAKTLAMTPASTGRSTGASNAAFGTTSSSAAATPAAVGNQSLDKLSLGPGRARSLQSPSLSGSAGNTPRLGELSARLADLAATVQNMSQVSCENRTVAHVPAAGAVSRLSPRSTRFGAYRVTPVNG
eukprot:jgi/Chrzof1/11074/Cz05g22150.t1